MGRGYQGYHCSTAAGISGLIRLLRLRGPKHLINIRSTYHGTFTSYAAPKARDMPVLVKIDWIFYRQVFASIALVFC